MAMGQVALTVRRLGVGTRAALVGASVGAVLVVGVLASLTSPEAVGPLVPMAVPGVWLVQGWVLLRLAGVHRPLGATAAATGLALLLALPSLRVAAGTPFLVLAPIPLAAGCFAVGALLFAPRVSRTTTNVLTAVFVAAVSLFLLTRLSPSFLW
ncbi:hypothetical protein [Streptomyces sp. TLI_171]|uniref:hypothetical protein n=1 Tax=Streptomyces sp. TLI_171 TaxID=1938859 RepID=UPI000C1A52BB|nr:hypothetical protein [Streptomyces sp. TLI_171]RKE22797.1 hypothetical protein BX266_6251 [Streptomyces sp. TLI_171]